MIPNQYDPATAIQVAARARRVFDSTTRIALNGGANAIEEILITTHSLSIYTHRAQREEQSG